MTHKVAILAGDVVVRHDLAIFKKIARVSEPISDEGEWDQVPRDTQIKTETS